MLPVFHRITISAVTALAVALPSAPALAFDAREQGVITGVIGTLLITGLINESNKHAQQRPPAYAPPKQPVVYSAYRSPAAAAFAGYSPSERRMIQRRLSRMGYYYGPIDGAFGPSTYRAVVDYARDQGVEAALASRRDAYSVYDGLIF